MITWTTLKSSVRALPCLLHGVVCSMAGPGGHLHTSPRTEGSLKTWLEEGEEENFLWQVRMLPLALALLLMINVSVRPSELSPRSDKLILGRQWLSLRTFSVAKEIPFNSRTFTFDISTSVYTRGTIYPDIFHSNTLFHYKCIMFFPFLCMKNNDLKSNISIYRKF